MSDTHNTILLERAYEVLEEVTNHPSGYDKALSEAIEKNDLEEIYRLTNMLEDELAKEHFYNKEIIVW